MQIKGPLRYHQTKC